jgi:uncharacterized membrane protein
MERVFPEPTDAFDMRVLLVCVVGMLVLAGIGGAASAQSAPSTEAETAITVALQSDGDARWQIETQLPLNSTNETRSFRGLGEDYVEGDTAVGYSIETFRVVSANVSEQTGREMAIANVSRSWDITEGNATTNGTGTLSVAFTWENFTRVDGDRVVVGDVFQTEPQWFPGLAAGQRLRIQAPRNYYVQSANTGHDNATLQFEGPTTFDGNEFEAEFAPSGDGGGGQFTPTPPLEIPVLGIGAAVATIAIAAIAYRLTRRRERPGEEIPGEAEQPARTDPDEAGEPDDPFADVDETLLSDEERIERHLEAAGGRMKQAKIVEKTGWSNAKVSQVLSGMADEGRVEKLRIGRENLISLPDEEE